MSKDNIFLNMKNRELDWVTIQEAIEIANKSANVKINLSEIFRHVLSRKIQISIYFQLPVILRKIKDSDNKLTLTTSKDALVSRLCFLDKNCFLNDRNLVYSTKGRFIYPVQNVIDTTLVGYEYVLVQRLLARSLNIPLPVTGAKEVNYGITVNFSGEIFQTFEKTTWLKRIEHQISQLPENVSLDLSEQITLERGSKNHRKGYFPLHDLPVDACFVIRYSELDKLIDLYLKNNKDSSSPTRISTPLSRLFWLACKHNEAISPLLRQPYKLLSIFEQWASDDGITDHLSGDTLKTALERGSPPSAS